MAGYVQTCIAHFRLASQRVWVNLAELRLGCQPKEFVTYKERVSTGIKGVNESPQKWVALGIPEVEYFDWADDGLWMFALVSSSSVILRHLKMTDCPEELLTFLSTQVHRGILSLPSIYRHESSKWVLTAVNGSLG